MSACLRRLLLGGCVAGFLLASPLWAWAERPKDVAEVGARVEWLSEERGNALFIPQVVFDHAHVEDLPLGKYSALRLRLNIQRNPEVYRSQFIGGVVPECWPADRPSRQGSHPAPKDLVTLLESRNEVYVGRVRGTIFGWDLHRNQVGQMVIVEVEERLRTTDEAGPPEDEVFMLLDGGTIRVDGTMLCDQIASEIYRPAVGDSVLLSGHEYPSNRQYLQGWLFPIVEGKVLPQPIPELQEKQQPVELPEVRGSLRQDSPAPGATQWQCERPLRALRHHQHVWGGEVRQCSAVRKTTEN